MAKLLKYLACNHEDEFHAQKTCKNTKHGGMCL